MHGLIRVFVILLLFNTTVFAHLGEVHPEGGAHDYFPDFPISDLSDQIRIRSVLDVVSARDLVQIPDDSGRFLAMRASNSVRITEFGEREQPYGRMDITDTSDTEGAVSIELHPDFTTEGSPGFGKLYTVTIEKEPTVEPDFTSVNTGKVMHSVISEWTTNDVTANRFSGTVREIMRFDQGSPFHNVNDLAFGPDGMLYVAVGEDTFGSQATDLQSVYGKILRIDPLGNNSANQAYGIPDDNPYVGQAETAPEVYAYGLRNPWRINFDRETGALFAGDVGWNSIEEMNLIEPTKNYGWPTKEGSLITATETPDEPDPVTGLTVAQELNLVDPLFEIDQTDSTSILGGVLYRGERFPDLVGKLIFGSWNNGDLFAGDLATGEIELLMEKGRVQEALGVARSVSVNEDVDGEIYIVGATQIHVLFPEPDFDKSGALDAPDGDIICANFGSESALYDLNGDLAVDVADLDVLMEYANTLQGDLDFNGHVEFADFLEFSQNFGLEGVTWSDGDINCDGTIAFDDFLVVSGNFGLSRTGVESVPEPSGRVLSLAAIALGFLARRRRTS